MQHARVLAPVNDVVHEPAATPAAGCRFLAYLAGDGPRHWAPGAETFIEAALLFAENVQDGGDGDLLIVVVDVETGASERFNLAPHAHEVKPC